MCKQIVKSMVTMATNYADGRTNTTAIKVVFERGGRAVLVALLFKAITELYQGNVKLDWTKYNKRVKNKSY